MNITGDSLTLAGTFIYNGNPRTLQLSGLTSGTRYKTTFFSVGWEASGRFQTFLNDSSAESLHVDQDHYGNNNGITMSHVFDATGATEDFTITPDTGGTFHWYALANREVAKGTVTSITNQPPTDRGITNVTVAATFSISGSVYNVWAYWGPTDGTTNVADWTNEVHLGTYTNVVDQDVSHTIGGLVASSTPFYTFRLSNALDSVWAYPSRQITAISEPEVTNTAPTVYVGSATLAGELTTGNVADVYIYWGTSDGGTVTTNWDSYVLLSDTLQGTFSSTVPAGYGVTYYYRCYATNALGQDWANITTNFVTIEPPAGGIEGINALNYDYYAGAAENEIATIDDGVANGQNGGLFDLTPTPDGSRPGAVQGKEIWTTEVGTGGLADQYCQMWWGYFHPPVSGTYTFYVHGDDYEILWLDVDQNGGEFEAGTDAISWNYPPEGWNTPHTETVDLTGGEAYAIAFTHREGGGGDNCDFKITKPSDSQREINPGDANQNGWWSQGWVQSLTATITNDAVSNVSTTSVTMNSTLNATGWVFDVWAYWGPTDGTNKAGAWSNSAHVGWVTNHEGAVNHSITGLTEQSGYYYTFQATNQVTNIWAQPSHAFETLGPIAVTNLPAGTLTVTSAVLRAQLLSGGSGDATIYWGTSDPGSTHVGWDQSESIPDVVMDPFEVTVPVLAGGTYYYRTYVTNAFNDDWGEPAESFIVPQAAVTLSVVSEGFSPSSISGCELWLAADDIDGDGDTTDNPPDGTPIDTWSDKSGNARDATREGTDQNAYNTTGPNGRPVVTFSDDYMSTAHNFDPLTRYTVLSVARYTGGDGERVISSATRNWLFGFHGNLNERFHAEGWIHTLGNSDPDWIVHAGHIDDDADPKASFYRDGRLLTANDTGSGANNYMIGRLGLGGYRNNNEESNCEIAEVLIYNRILSASELDQIGRHLADKYGVSTEYPVFLNESGPGEATVTATLNVPAISNVTVNFTLAGGTPNRLTHKGYHNNPWSDDILDLDNNGGLMAMTPNGITTLVSGPADRGLDFNDDGDFQESGAVTWGDNYQNLFIGYFNAPETGSYEFKIEVDDDRCGIWIDRDRDGVFESSTPGLGQNRGEQLAWEDHNTHTVTLTNGLSYMFAVTHSEGGGGSQIDARFKTPSMGAQIVIRPADPVQAGMWSDINSLASSPADYTGTVSSVLIPAGSLSSNITIVAVDDLAQEEDEGFEVSIASVINATSGAPDSVVGIINSEDPQVTTGDGFTSVSAPDATLNGVLTMGDSADVTIYWGTSDGGTTQSNWGATCVVGTVSEDMGFSTNITGLVGGVTYYYRCYATNDSNLAEDWSGVVSTSIPAAAVSIDDVSVTEGDAGTVDAVFTISLSAINATNVSVDYATAGGTASAGSDYNAVTSSVTIAAGLTSTQITVQVLGDTVFEHPSETFNVNLSNPVGGTIGDGQGVGTITDDDASVHLAAWRNRMKITFDGYAGGSTLTNWPALVRLSGSIPGFDYATFASTNGFDLRFANAGETEVLNFEIENWSTGAESVVWVQLPELPAGGTYIWAYWNNPAETVLPSWLTHGSVWDANFRGLWHANNTAVDSTTYANDATADSSVDVSGNIGGGKSFNGSNQAITIGNKPDHNITGDMTLSAWVKPDPASAGEDCVIGRWGDSYILEINNKRPRLHIDGWRNASTTLAGGTWDLVVATYEHDPGTVRLYLNGQPDGVHSYKQYAGIDDTLYLGRRGGQWFQGELDEFRISDTARSADWLLANYSNQVQNSTFNTYGTVEGKPAIDIVNGAINLTVESADLTASLTSTGTAATTVWVLWGDDDAGQVFGSWDSNELVGAATTVPSNYVKSVSNLADSTQYFYAYLASNTYGTIWAATNYYTFGRPAVNNGTGADAGIGYATLNGNLVSTGGTPTVVHTYWGNNDGDTNKLTQWDYVITNVVSGQGPFSASTPTNLIYGRRLPPCS
jgi:hypothetical protein